MSFRIPELLERYNGSEALEILFDVAKTVDWLQDVTFKVGNTGVGDVVSRVTPGPGEDIISAMGGVSVHELGAPAQKTGTSKAKKEPYNYFCFSKEIGIPVESIEACPPDQRTTFVETEIKNQTAFMMAVLPFLILEGVTINGRTYKGLASDPSYGYSDGEFVVNAGGTGGSAGKVFDAWLINWSLEGCNIATPADKPGGLELKYRGVNRVPVYSLKNGIIQEEYQYQEIWTINMILAPIVGIPGSIVRICNIDPYGVSGGKTLTKKLIHNAKGILKNDIGTLQLLTAPGPYEQLGEDIALTPTLVRTPTNDFGKMATVYSDVILRKCASLGADTPLTSGWVPGGGGTEPETVTVPDVVGLSEAAAGAAIASVGLVVGDITRENDNEVAAGLVLEQDPEGGEEVAPETEVDLVVSLGPEQVAVPDVVGMTQAAAETAITTAGLTVGTVTEEYSDTVPSGDVISQNPVANTVVDRGSAVNLVVSKGTEP